MQQILWTCCVFLSSLNNTFFSVLIIIFSNKSYFCFNYTKCFFHSCHELYFSVVLRIIFPMCIKNYFLIGPRIIFHGIANLFLVYNALRALHLKWTGSSLLTSLGDHFWAILKKIAHMSVVWVYVSLWLCIFVTLYLCIFVSLYVQMFVQEPIS